MTVKLYVSRDSEGRQWAPDHAHEAEAAQEIAQHLWAKLHHADNLYVLLANLHEPSADLVFLSERGVGVVELKHSRGRITIDPGGWWCADGMPITSGRRDNPHLQVQAYTEKLREKILPYILPKDVRNDPSRHNSFKCSTAVCFTHPAAELSTVRDAVRREEGIRRKPWESGFSVLIIDDLPSWVAALRHGLDQGKAKQYEPYRLAPETMVNVASIVLNATEWAEILELMPDGEPWGYLLALESEHARPTALVKDTITIGRDPDSTVVVPEEYDRVSRRHARIVRGLKQIELEHVGMNATYINGARVTGARRLQHGDTIELGATEGSDKRYLLQFKLRSREGFEVKATAPE